MGKLEDLKPGAIVRGILPSSLVTITSVKWYGQDSLKLTYEDASGRADNRLLYRDDESQFDIETEGRPWSFIGDSGLFRMVARKREEYTLPTSLIPFLRFTLPSLTLFLTRLQQYMKR